MDWEQVRKNFEKWRKNFLKKKKYTINDKRRNLEPDGDEPPPDVYGKLDKKTQEYLENPILFGESALKDYVLIPGYIEPNEQNFRDIGHSQDSRGYVEKKPDRKIITKHDIYDMRIELELCDDVNEFIEQM